MKYILAVFVVIVFFSGCGNIVTNHNNIILPDDEVFADNDFENSDIEKNKDDLSDVENDNEPDNDDSRIDFSGPDFSGTTILIINGSPDGETFLNSGTLDYMLPLPASKIPTKIPKFLRNDLRPPLPEGLGKPVMKKPVNLPAKFVKGDTDLIYIYDFGSNSMNAVASTLKYIGTKIEIWKADDVSFSDQDIQIIGEEFDSEIYSLVTDNFYSESDVDGNLRVSIILANLGGYAAGYFSPTDYYTKSQYPESNFRDLIYIESGMEIGEIFSTMTHEFQHLVHSNRNIIDEGDWGSGELYYRWIDEGLATAAQQMYEGAQQDMLYVINNDGYNQSIANGNSFLYWDYDSNEKVYSDYAMAYVFFQYLRIHAGKDTSIYNEIIECTSNDYKCVENVIKSRVGSAYTFTDFLVDFRIAMILQDNSGKYGFGGEKAFSFTMPYFDGSSASLRGGGAVYLYSAGSFTKPADVSDGLTFVGINGN